MKNYNTHQLYEEVAQHYRNTIDPVRKKVPVDIEKIAHLLDIKVVAKVLAPGVSGVIQKIKGGSILVMYELTESRKRQRFTIAHEISHFLLGHLEKEQFLSENKLLRSNRLSNAEERDANYLAAELLMPMEEIDRLIEASQLSQMPFTPKDLADILEVSEQALRIRLGII